LLPLPSPLPAAASPSPCCCWADRRFVLSETSRMSSASWADCGLLAKPLVALMSPANGRLGRLCSDCLVGAVAVLRNEPPFAGAVAVLRNELPFAGGGGYITARSKLGDVTAAFLPAP